MVEPGGPDAAAGGGFGTPADRPGTRADRPGTPVRRAAVLVAVAAVCAAASAAVHLAGGRPHERPRAQRAVEEDVTAGAAEAGVRRSAGLVVSTLEGGKRAKESAHWCSFAWSSLREGLDGTRTRAEGEPQAYARALTALDRRGWHVSERYRRASFTGAALEKDGWTLSVTADNSAEGLGSSITFSGGADDRPPSA